jgi:DNA-binding MarR family transcriptional regulator
MQLGQQVRALLALYPRVFMACHTRHVRDPGSARVLSEHQASILDHLDEKMPTTLGGLARHMGVTASTMSIAIERLVRGGYVSRRKDKDDARRVGLTLTASGARVREANQVLDPDRVRALLARLAPGEREQAIRGLELLAGAAQAELPNKRLYGLRDDVPRSAVQPGESE